MADFTLVARSPLAGLAEPGRHGCIEGPAGVHLREIINFEAWAILARKNRVADVAEVLAHHLGSPVPDAPRRTGHAGLSVTGTGPGRWLALARDRMARETWARIASDLGPTSGTHGLAAVVEQTDGRIVLEITGPAARRALAKGVAIDLDPAVFVPGHAVETMAAHLSIGLALLADAETFELIAHASTAGSLWHWLEHATAEFGLEVMPLG